MMQQELTKQQKTIATIILIVALVFLYNFIQSETKEEVKPVEKVAKTNVDHFFTIQQNENGYYTPENYLLAYYNNINTENWSYLLQNSLKEYDESFIKGQFRGRKLKGVRIVSTEKENKFKAIVTADITFTNIVKDTISKRVKAQLQLATDYQNWIVAPLTIF